MGKMAEPTDDERLERRKLAHAIVKSVEEDESMPRSINAEYEETCAALAQEIVMLERCHMIKVPIAVVTTPQEHPVLTFRKMWATLVSARADGKPYEVGDLVCIDVPLNCTIESTHSMALTRMRVAAAILAPLWPGSEVMNEDPSTCDVSGLSLVDEIVAAAKMIGDMPDA